MVLQKVNLFQSLVKYDLCNHFILPNCFILGGLINARRRARGDGGRDLFPVRNYPGEVIPKLFTTYSPSYKKSYFYRACNNYNVLRRLFDLDEYDFRSPRRILSLFSYDYGGLVIPFIQLKIIKFHYFFFLHIFYFFYIHSFSLHLFYFIFLYFH